MTECFRIWESDDQAENPKKFVDDFIRGRETKRIVTEVLTEFEEAEESRENKTRMESISKIKIESPSETVTYLVGALRNGSVFYDKASRNYFTMFYQKYREWLEDSIWRRIKKEFDVHFRIEEYTPRHFRLKLSSKEMYTMWKNRF